MAKITTVFGKDGESVTVSVDGVKGKSCLDMTKFIEEALHMKNIQTSMTPESLQETTEDDNLLTA
jgi:hypothetical protein